MASRIIHFTVANAVAASRYIKDKNRFILGTLLPDAYSAGMGTAKSHFKIYLDGTLKRTYDLERFREMFSGLLTDDDLYKGYYLHLVQDLHFRAFVYGKYSWDPTVSGNVDRLHGDYSITNAYVIRKYGLENSLCVPSDISDEAISAVYPFDTLRLAADLESDFRGEDLGDTFFFTREMADEFIEIACAASVAELDAIECGTFNTDMRRMAWDNKK